MEESYQSEFGDGVYYAAADYAGYLRRLTAHLIDGTLLLIAWYVVWEVILQITWNGADFTTDPVPVFYATMFAVSWFYLAVLKPSRWRTAGYRVADLKIVNLLGERPSTVRMTFRLLLWIFGPFHFLLDLMWISADVDQQTIRDCLSGTCVIRSGASPAGTGPIHVVYYHVTGFALMYKRVRHPSGPPEDRAESND